MIKGNLYSKMIGWFFLGMLLIATVGVGFLGYVLFGSSDGLLPSNMFSVKVENAFRIISADIQYKPTREWRSILATYDKPGSLTYHLVSLDEFGLHYTDRFVPQEILDAAARVPRTPFTLCPDPSLVFRDSDMQGYESGLAPSPPALFLRTGKPARYWYGRVLFVPDDNQKPHHLLLAVESPSLSGDGLFFNFKTVLYIIAGVGAFCCLWWWPFVMHLTWPLQCMSKYAEFIASHDNAPGGKRCEPCVLSKTRKDEIGRLSRALNSMADRLTQRMLGQQQFIRHIAHELNTPLARSKLGLAVLEERLEGDNRDRVRQALLELEDLSRLTDDVLAFLRAQAAPEPASLECLELCPLLTAVVRARAPEADVHVLVPSDLTVWGDKLHIRQAVGNILDNALTYAGIYGPIIIEAREIKGGKATESIVVLSVRDKGPGVGEEDLALLQEPFYRGAAAQQHHPGGSGLGLAIARSSVEQCGGYLRFANLPGGGFEVTMCFMRGLCVA